VPRLQTRAYADGLVRRRNSGPPKLRSLIFSAAPFQKSAFSGVDCWENSSWTHNRATSAWMSAPRQAAKGGTDPAVARPLANAISQRGRWRMARPRLTQSGDQAAAPLSPAAYALRAASANGG
jgi:hypothetical protein